MYVLGVILANARLPIKVKRCIVNSETKRNKLKKQIIKDQLLRERMVNNHSRTEKEKKHYGKVI